MYKHHLNKHVFINIQFWPYKRHPYIHHQNNHNVQPSYTSDDPITDKHLENHERLRNGPQPWIYRNIFNIPIKRELELIFFDASISYVPTLINHGHTESRARIANAIYMADRSFAIVFVYFFYFNFDLILCV